MLQLKPAALRAGDKVATLSLSWGGPSLFPHIYDRGVRNVEELLGLRVVEYPTARMADSELHANPRVRAEDLNRAFADPGIRAIFCSIGGDDSVRILPFLDLDTILKNPKILMGFSDTTTKLAYLNIHGLVTYNGPSIMAGFAQMHQFEPAFLHHVRDILMSPQPRYEFPAFTQFTNGYADWNTPGNDGEPKELQPTDGWKWLQGSGRCEGVLFGGNIEVLEFLKSTQFWPAQEFWNGRILFFETSEEQPTVSNVKYMLRNYGMQGVYDQISGMLFGRARGYTPQEKADLYKTIVDVVAGEFGATNLPIVANLDFGHTDPQWIMPLGIQAEIDCDRRTLALTEPAITAK